jgi:hypothetical protein
MTQEEMMYNIIFPSDEDPNHINYGHFITKSKRNLYEFKATIEDSQLNPVLIMDGERKNAFFVEVFQSEVDGFLKLTDEFKFKQIKMSKGYMNEVKFMFKDYLLMLSSKKQRISKSVSIHKHIQSINMSADFLNI